MRVSNYAGLSAEQLALIESELGEHHGLSDVFKWGQAQPPGAVLPQVIASVVGQDEYTHDAIVPWRDGLVLVYGAT
jgi:hypothetical protein